MERAVPKNQYIRDRIYLAKGKNQETLIIGCRKENGLGSPEDPIQVQLRNRFNEEDFPIRTKPFKKNSLRQQEPWCEVLFGRDGKQPVFLSSHPSNWKQPSWTETIISSSAAVATCLSSWVNFLRIPALAAPFVPDSWKTVKGFLQSFNPTQSQFAYSTDALEEGDFPRLEKMFSRETANFWMRKPTPWEVQNTLYWWMSTNAWCGFGVSYDVFHLDKGIRLYPVENHFNAHTRKVFLKAYGEATKKTFKKLYANPHYLQLTEQQKYKDVQTLTQDTLIKTFNRDVYSTFVDPPELPILKKTSFFDGIRSLRTEESD